MCKKRRDEKPVTIEQVETLMRKKNTRIGDKKVCPIHDIIMQDLEEHKLGVKETLKELRDLFFESRNFVIKTIIGVLCGAFILFGGTIVGLVVFIFKELAVMRIRQ
jgi:uncharacterized membrane protein YjjP (DUF1212 family)